MKCEWNDSSRSFYLISVTLLDLLTGDKGPLVSSQYLVFFQSVVPLKANSTRNYAKQFQLIFISFEQTRN